MARLEHKLKHLSETGKKLRLEISEQVFSYIGAGFGLIASLAWNEAIKATIEYFFPLKQDTIMAKFVYAIAMTLVLVVVTLYLVKVLKLHRTIDNKQEE